MINYHYQSIKQILWMAVNGTATRIERKQMPTSQRPKWRVKQTRFKHTLIFWNSRKLTLVSIRALRIHTERSALLKSWRYLSQRWNNLPSNVDEKAPSAHDETQQARRFVYFEDDRHAPAHRVSSVTGRPHYFNQVNWAFSGDCSPIVVQMIWAS